MADTKQTMIDELEATLSGLYRKLHTLPTKPRVDIGGTLEYIEEDLAPSGEYADVISYLITAAYELGIEAERQKIHKGFIRRTRISEENPDRTGPTKQTWKRSKPVRSEGQWRIRRHDGVLVGWYDTKALAQRAIDRAPHLR